MNRRRADPIRSRARTTLAVLLIAAAASFPVAAEIPLAERRSGYDFMGPDTRAIQDEDTSNPAMLWALDGEALWSARAGASGRSCTDCHGDAATSMKGVAARYPRFSATRGRPVALDQQVNTCRTERQQASPFAYESKELLALTTYLGTQSRGLPVDVAIDARTQPFLDAGRRFYLLRQGQLNLSCAQCHDDNWGKRLAGSVIPQAHPTGYPIYRLEWQSVGSLQRRLRNCLIGMRAAPFPYGADALVDLELYLMWRARGMKVETPAVRP